MSVLSLAVCHVVLKFTGVDVTLSMPECTFALGFVKVPLTFVVSTIYPVLETVTVPYIVFVFHFTQLAPFLACQACNLLHLSSIARVVREYIDIYVFKLGIILEVTPNLIQTLHIQLVDFVLVQV